LPGADTKHSSRRWCSWCGSTVRRKCRRLPASSS
jgi:hypothetical protein